jgi:polyribonucleotide nucleotidyltransferase
MEGRIVMSEKAMIPVGDKQIIIETGKLAKQADGAVTVQMGETIVLVAAVGAAKGQARPGFLSLNSRLSGKAAAAGKFPGGYLSVRAALPEKEISLPASLIGQFGLCFQKAGTMRFRFNRSS